MTYLNVVEVESAMVSLASAYPTVTELIALPYPTYEGRTSHALRIGHDSVIPGRHHQAIKALVCPFAEIAARGLVGIATCCFEHALQAR